MGGDISGTDEEDDRKHGNDRGPGLGSVLLYTATAVGLALMFYGGYLSIRGYQHMRGGGSVHSSSQDSRVLEAPAADVRSREPSPLEN